MDGSDALLAAKPGGLWPSLKDHDVALAALVAVIRALQPLDRDRQRTVLVAAAAYLELPGAWDLNSDEQEQSK